MRLVNWRLHNTLSKVILATIVLLLLGVGAAVGIEDLTNKFFGLPLSWLEVLGIGGIYVFIIYHQFTNN